jgi:hypothetical protein
MKEHSNKPVVPSFSLKISKKKEGHKTQSKTANNSNASPSKDRQRELILPTYHPLIKAPSTLM